MKRLPVALLMFVQLPPLALAQWPEYRSPDVPRQPDGTPDPEASAPRTPWGTPDLSGVWERFRGFASAEEDAASQPSGDGPPAATFFDLGANFDAGLSYRPWARELRAQRIADGMKDNPDANCLPMGHMQVDITIIDDTAYTEPFTVRVEHGIMLDTELIEFICNENEKSTRLFDP